jgi:20S proteasome alpha/beta subunit
MTIGVGFLCSDGVVIGADRQLTGAGYTFPECKMHMLKWKNGRAIWTYSGLHDTAREFIKEIESRFFKVNAEIPESQVRPLLSECLEACVQKRDGFQTLFGYWIEGERQKLLVSKQKRILDAGKCEIIGWGNSSLSRYLRDGYMTSLARGSVTQALVYAVHFISQAEKFNGEFCGGGTDVFLINDKNETRVLDAGAAPALEQKISSMQHHLSYLFANLSDAQYSDEIIDQCLNNFRTGPVARFREWITEKPSS